MLHAFSQTMSKFESKLQHGILLGLAGGVLAFLLNSVGLLDRLENVTWDMRVRLLARPAPTTASVRLIFVDQASLDWAAEHLGLPWPWPREVYRAILDFCRRGEVRSVTFDVMFTEASAYGVDDDLEFQAAIEQGPPFAGALFLGRESGAHTNIPPNTDHALGPPLTIASRKGMRWLTGLHYPYATFPIDEVRSAATVLGNVAAVPDADGVFRRLPPFGLFDGRFVPTLGVAAYLAELPGTTPRLHPNALQLADRRIPLDRKGRAIFRYRGPSQTHPTVSAAAVINSELRLREGLEPQIDPAVFSNTRVLLGFTAPGLFDLKTSPVAGIYPGVEIHATLLDNLLGDDFIRPFPGILHILAVMVLAIVYGITARQCGSALWGGILLIGAPAIPMAFGILGYMTGHAIPVATLQSALIAAGGGGLLVNFAIEGRQRRFLKNAFNQYLSREVIEQLIAHPERLQLGGEEREVSLFFSDIRGFTTLSESLSPTDLTTVLNDYLTMMCDVILASGGTIDKFEGDAVIAFWNAPLSQPDHAIRAVNAAIRCQEQLAAMAPDFEQRVGVPLFTRIGLHTGLVVVGNLGSRQRFNYTFLGDAGNLGSRIEGVNKVFGTRVLLTGQTADRVGDHIAVREIATIRVVGRSAPVVVFEPIATTPSKLARHDIVRFANALEAWKRGDPAAAGEQFAALVQHDPVAAAYRDRCWQLAGTALPDPWDGIWNLTDK